MDTAEKTKKMIHPSKVVLATKAADELLSVFAVESIPETLRDGFIDAFSMMQNKTVERFRGLVAGVPKE